MKRKSGTWLCLLLPLSLGCGPEVDVEAETAAVNAVIDQHMQANETKDVDLYLSSWATDGRMVNLGMSGEHWVGRDELRDHAVEAYAQTDEIQFTARDRVVNIGPNGRIAWFLCYIDFIGRSQDQPVAMTGIRFTGVLEKQDDRWVYVQTHASLPSPAPETEE